MSVNKPFKKKKKKKYNQYIIENGEKDNTLFHNHHAKVDRKLIVQWVHEIWENDINTNIIFLYINIFIKKFFNFIN